MKRSLVYLAVLAAMRAPSGVRCSRCGGYGHLPKDCGWPAGVVFPALVG